MSLNSNINAEDTSIRNTFNINSPIANDDRVSSCSMSPLLQQQRFDKNKLYNEISESILTDTLSVDTSIKIMDSRYKTSFYSWIKNEENVDYISGYLKPLIIEYSNDADGIEKISRAIQWLTLDWSLNSTAGLLIKCLYDKGLTSQLFTNIIQRFVLGKKWAEVVDLIATLLIGESSYVVSKFIFEVSQEWDLRMIVDLIESLSVVGKWNENFKQSFLQQYRQFYLQSGKREQGQVENLVFESDLGRQIYEIFTSEDILEPQDTFNHLTQQQNVQNNMQKLQIACTSQSSPVSIALSSPESPKKSSF